MITCGQADSILQAAKSKAEEIGITVSVVVMDAGGNLKAFSRMDGAWLGSVDVAIKKAKTSVLFEMETQMVWQFSNPDGPAHGMDSTNGGLITFAGGIPLKTPTGQLLGAVGVSGGMVDQDESVARAGLAVLAVSSGDEPAFQETVK
jgi:uncharacterized protein GlcG (DUF336 family)